jgi:hypothetical protein
MEGMMRRATDRTPAESLRSDLQSVRTPSQPLRIDAKSEFLAAINETRVGMGLSIEAMAINAGCPLSSMSDALAGKDGRNFAGPWLLAQGDAFVARFNEIVSRRRGGLTEAQQDAIEAEQIGRLVEAFVQRSFRLRRREERTA